MQSSNHIGKIVRNHAVAVENGKVPARKRKAKGSGSGWGSGWGSGSGSGSSFLSVPRHRAFVPMVTIWGGVFMALIMAVMPDYAVAHASSLSGVYVPLIAARVILAVGVGLAGALLGFIVASALASYIKQKQGDDDLVSKARKSREFEPINPVAELGSESLDAPIDLASEEPAPEEPAPHEAPAAKREPTLGELEQRGYDIEAPEEFAEAADNEGQAEGDWAFTRKHFKNALIESCEGATCEAAANAEFSSEYSEKPVEEPKVESLKANLETSLETGPETRPETGFASLRAEQITPERRPISEKRTALDLGASSALSELEDQPIKAAEAQAPARAPAPATALEALRQKPAGELSLVEMVERFAAALHDHQAHERAQFERKQKGRDAALAEALKALTLFTENGFDENGFDRAQPAHGAPGQIAQTEEELRSALTRLQGLRGAA